MIAGDFPRQRVDQFVLPVSGHPRDAEDLSRPQIERDVFQRHPERALARRRQPAHRQAHLSGRQVARLGGGQFRADHHLGQRLGAFAARIARAHHLAVAQDGGGGAKRADFFKLMRDIEDRYPFVAQLAQGAEQDLHLLRGQDGGRLIHDQQFGRLQQAAHDFHALAGAHRQLPHDAPRLERQAVGGGDLADPVRQIAPGLRGRQPQRDVFRHGQRVEQ